MNAEFANLVEVLELSFPQLIQMRNVRADLLPPGIPKQGTYLFSEGPTHRYVGRSDNIRRRVRSNPGGYRASELERALFNLGFDTKEERAQFLEAIPGLHEQGSGPDKVLVF